MMKHNGIYVCIAFCIFVLISFVMPACSDDNSNNSTFPQVGDRMIIEGRADDQLLFQEEYDYYEIDTSGTIIPYKGGKNVISIYTTGTNYTDDATTYSLFDPATVDDIQNFIDEWLAANTTNKSYPSAATENQSVDSFIEFLRESCSANLDYLIGLYKQSGMTTNEFRTTLETTAQLPDDTYLPIVGLSSLLDNMSITLEQLDADLKELGITTEDYFLEIKNFDYNFDTLIDSYLKEDWQSASDFLDASYKGKLNDKTQGAHGNNGLGNGNVTFGEVKRSWRIAKTGVCLPWRTPLGSETTPGKTGVNIIPSKDPEITHYDTGAHTYYPPEVSLEVRNIFGKFATNYVHPYCKYPVKNTKYNDPNDPKVVLGSYLRLLEFGGYLKGWQIISFMIRGESNAQIKEIRNVGGYYNDPNNPPVVEVKFVATLTIRTSIQCFNKEFRWIINGNTGGKLLK